MTKEQIEQKALELYPVRDTGLSRDIFSFNRAVWTEGALFMQEENERLKKLLKDQVTIISLDAYYQRNPDVYRMDQESKWLQFAKENNIT